MSAEDFDLSGYTLFERQSKFYNGSHCPYCMGLTDLVDSIEVYQESHGLIYICRKCRAWCGTHKNAHNNNDQSLGCLAKKPLRDLRNECHKFFEPLVVVKMQKDNVSKRKAKASAYNWLAGILKIETVESHIGYFNLSQCNFALEALKAIYPTPEQIAKREHAIKWNVDTWLFNAEDYGLEIKEFRLMNIHRLDIFQKKSNKRLTYYPKDNTALWSSFKKRNKTVDCQDIEKFIETHFK